MKVFTVLIMAFTATLAAQTQTKSPTGGNQKKSGSTPPASGIRKTAPLGQRQPAAKPTAVVPSAKNSRTPMRYSRRRITRASIAAVPSNTERYKQIQDALAARGYLKSPSTGVWDNDTVDAMKRFQQEHNLEPTGKVTSRSLIALGLGSSTAAPSAVPSGPNDGVGH